MSVSKDDIFRTLIAVVLSLLAFICNSIRTEQADLGSRLRIVELNQARIMERMGVERLFSSASGVLNKEL